MTWRDFQHLKIGEWYEIVREFSDFDSDVHPVGEAWKLLGHSFLPYDDGLSLFTSAGGDAVQQIRLRWVKEDQGEIIDNLESYIKLAGGTPRKP